MSHGVLSSVPGGGLRMPSISATLADDAVGGLVLLVAKGLHQPGSVHLTLHHQVRWLFVMLCITGTPLVCTVGHLCVSIHVSGDVLCTECGALVAPAATVGLMYTLRKEPDESGNSCACHASRASRAMAVATGYSHM